MARAVAAAPAIQGNSPMLRICTGDGQGLPLLGEVSDELAADAKAREWAEVAARAERTQGDGGAALFPA